MLKPFVLMLGFAVTVSACSPKLPDGVDDYTLQEAVAASVGDQSTCVLISDKAGKEVWRQGALTACTAAWPACTKAGAQTVQDLAKETAGAPAFATGCESVSWASGPVPGDSGLSYAAVMRGERALPGREIARRLELVFERAGF